MSQDSTDKSAERRTRSGAEGAAKINDKSAHPSGVPTDVVNHGPAANGKRMYQGLSASSAGLELGVAVAIGALFGRWLDTEFDTAPWLMLVFLLFGVVAGFRGMLRAVARAEKAASRE